MEHKLNLTNETNQKAVKLFLVIVLVLSAIAEGIIIYTGAMGLAILLMGVPALAAVITKIKYFKGEKYALSVRKCNIKYIGLAVLLPLLYIGIPYLIYWIINPESLQLELTPMLIGSTVVGIVINMLPAFGEELGWRGFLVPRLQQWLGLEKMLILTGLIWGAWHCPLLISGLYMPGTPIWFKVPMFIIVVGSVGVIIAILTLRSGSIWPATVMHSAHNVIDQTIFGAGTVGADKMYFVSETGIITAVLVVGMAIWMYRSYKKDGRGTGE